MLGKFSTDGFPLSVELKCVACLHFVFTWSGMCVNKCVALKHEERAGILLDRWFVLEK